MTQPPQDPHRPQQPNFGGYPGGAPGHPQPAQPGPAAHQGPAHQGQSAQATPATQMLPQGAPTQSSARRTTGKGAGGGLLAGALLLGALGGVGGAAGYGALAGEEPTTTQEPSSMLSGLDPLEIVSVNSVAKDVLPSVVKITVSLPDGRGGYGSGSVLTPDGEILTNNHVVAIAANGGTITVSFSDGRNARADLVGTDPRTDLALIKVTEAADLPVITLGDSDAVEVGQAVVAVGSPFGLDATVTAGIVSALHRPLVMPLNDDPNQISVYGAIQTDAPINPGNSGGALINMRGELIGVNSVIATAQSADGQQGDNGNVGIGYAIPISDAMPIVEELRNGQTATHARLGLSGADAEFAPLVPGGAVVNELEPGGAAEAAGIQQGDIITALGDIHVASWEGLLAATLSFRPDEATEVTLLRNGTETQVPITMGSDA